MTRRQFIACLLMAAVALLLLPLERFCEWGERWFERDKLLGIKSWLPGPDSSPFFSPRRDLSQLLRVPYRTA